MPNAKIPLRNLNWLRTVSIIDGKGTLHGVKIAELFDDVSNAYGKLAAQLAAIQVPAAASPVPTKVVTTVVMSSGGGGGGGGGGSTGPNFADGEVPAGTIGSGNKNFSLANTPSPATSLRLVWNGVTLEMGVGFTLSGNAITLSAGTNSGDTLVAWYRYGTGGSTPNFADGEIPFGAINGSNVTFTLAQSPNPAASLEFAWNGIVLAQGVGYTLSGAAITMSVAPSSGDTLVAWYRY